ncbi:MAG: glycosyltransferase family 4 protein [Bacteroidales bacterium]|nr:glycosyltransferase family 4 protein [Bacteroidales bacterium]
MKIGMVLDGVFPPDARVENEAVSLIDGGHEVFLYCFDLKGDQPSHEVIKGIHVHRHRISPRAYKFSALAYTVPVYHVYMKKSIRAFIKATGVEILHIHDLQVARSVFSVNRKFQLPVVLDLHENRPEIMKFYTHVQTFPGNWTIYPSVWKRFEKRYIRKADHVVVVTKEARDHYMKEMAIEADKFKIVPNTVRKEFYTNYDLSEEIIKVYKDNFTLLYLGETGFRRGIETMIRALTYLVKEIPSIRLVVVGKSKADNYYHELTRELGYEKYVDLPGWKDASLFPSYILASDVGTCPIHKNLHHDTTYANKIFQYLSLGKPILVSDCDAQANIANDYNCGLVFRDRDEQDFASKVLQFYNDRQLRLELGENGRKAIEEHLNWNIMSKELINLYGEYERRRI